MKFIKYMVKVKIYTTPTCPYCKSAKKFLKENNVKFKEFDVTKDDKARGEMVEKSGQIGVPVIEVNEEIIIGFDVDKLKEKLKL